MNKLIIHKAIPEDLAALTDLLEQLFSIEKDFVIDADKQQRGLTMMLEDPASRCIMVAEEDHTVIGMCTAQLLISTAEGGKAALIEDMVVAADHKGQGIGRLLMTAVEEWSLAQGARRLELLADRNNTPALKFYEALNWKSTELVCLHKK
ncbi:MAG TPA: GNAT family N-acetyltransferase [Bacillota bacterium]|nr:GNAT family N-acetyltransferase [Bacillota bacterium]